MTTISLDTNLDVLSKYKQLIQQSLTEGSAYIRTKETLIDMFKKGYIKDDQVVQVLSSVIASANQAMLSTSMNVALKWAETEKSLALQKLELEAKLENINKDTALKDAEADKTKYESISVQAGTIRNFGTPTVDSTRNKVLSLSDNGKVYAEQLNIEKDTANKKELNNQIKAQTKEVYARMHRTIADTYVNHGIYKWTTVDENGITGVSKNSKNTTLSDLQAVVAKEQAKGYSYNAWANAASSSSGMIGTLIAAEIPGLDPTNYLKVWNTTVSQLQSVSAPKFKV